MLLMEKSGGKGCFLQGRGFITPLKRALASTAASLRGLDQQSSPAVEAARSTAAASRGHGQMLNVIAMDTERDLGELSSCSSWFILELAAARKSCSGAVRFLGQM